MEFELSSPINNSDQLCVPPPAYSPGKHGKNRQGISFALTYILFPHMALLTWSGKYLESATIKISVSICFWESIMQNAAMLKDIRVHFCSEKFRNRYLMISRKSSFRLLSKNKIFFRALVSLNNIFSFFLCYFLPSSLSLQKCSAPMFSLLVNSPFLFI